MGNRENIIEFYIDDLGKFNYKLIGEFKDYKEYLNKVFIKYDMDKQFEIKYVFLASEINNIIKEYEQSIFDNNIKPEEKMYFNLYQNGFFGEAGFFNNNSEYLEYYNGEMQDIVFYGNKNEMDEIIADMKHLLNNINISDNEKQEINNYLISFNDKELSKN